jgi:hypothetical protein
MAPKADHGEDTYRGASLGEVGGPVIHIRFMLVVLWGRLERLRPGGSRVVPGRVDRLAGDGIVCDKLVRVERIIRIGEIRFVGF